MNLDRKNVEKNIFVCIIKLNIYAMEIERSVNR